MLKTTDNGEYPFTMHQTKALEFPDLKRNPTANKPNPPNEDWKNSFFANKEIFLLKFSQVESPWADKSDILAEIESLKKLLKTKIDFDEGCCLFSEISKGKSENKQLAKQLQDLEEEASGLSKTWEQEQKAFSDLEADLLQSIQERRTGYEKNIEELNEKLQKLNRVLEIYQKFLRIIVKKNKEDYICTAVRGNKEMVFSFVCNSYFTTYIPLKVNFQSSDFLNYKIEDLNRQELNILFSRLLKILHTNTN